MTTAALRSNRAEVVLTKPGTVASVGWAGSIIFGTAVAARTTDRVEAGAAVRTADQHILIAGVADVAGSAIVTHHGLMDTVEGASPGRAGAERTLVGIVQKASVTSLTAAGEGVRLIGLSCSRPDRGKTEQRYEKYQ
jgi:hypothetical protein